MLPVLVLAQLAGTSPWFAVNAVMPDLQRAYGWAAADVGPLTSAVQAGFILGTLVFALLAVADRFPARRVFLCCALASAGCSLAAAAGAASFGALWAWRAATGFCLAGIYPVGMKIAAGCRPKSSPTTTSCPSTGRSASRATCVSTENCGHTGEPSTTSAIENTEIPSPTQNGFVPPIGSHTQT